MAGPIQTAIGSLINTSAGALAIGKKISDDERQAGEKAAKEAKAAKAEADAEAKAAAEEEAKAKKQKQLSSAALKEEKKEAQAVATEADIRLLGGTPEAALAYRLAQERGLASPKRIIYDKEGTAVATYEEVAQILADQSREGSVSSLLRGRNAVKNRRALLSGKTHEQRVKEAVLASGGGK